MKHKKILITGANGFLGQYLVERLSKEKSATSSVIVRRGDYNFPENVLVHVDHLKNYEIKDTYFNDVDQVIHCAARAHVFGENDKNALEIYRDVNTVFTMKLAEKAAKNGVKRFVFISSIKVLGEFTQSGKPFTNTSDTNPEDSYALSKHEAELGLINICKENGMDFVIIRPPLIYGPGVKGNFLKLLKLSKFKMPLPFGSFKNRRSLVSVKNLVDLIVTCVFSSKAKNQIFLVSDGKPLSTAKIIDDLLQQQGNSSLVFRFPMVLLRAMSIIFNKQNIYKRLAGDLVVDIEHTNTTLNWYPPQTWKDGISECMKWYLHNGNKNN